MDLFVRDMSLVLAPLPDFVLHNVPYAPVVAGIVCVSECLKNSCGAWHSVHTSTMQEKWTCTCA
jgi:hypothetical protein